MVMDGRHARALDVMRAHLSQLEREYPRDACWPFARGAARRNSYGKITVGGRTFGAHRLALETVGGELAPGALARHHCDWKPCVNPRHLVVGTVADNSADAAKRGQLPRGARHRNARLTEAQARRIKFGAGRGADVARLLGVSDATVSLIRSGKSWKHLEEIRG